MALKLAKKPTESLPTDQAEYSTEGVFLASWLMYCGHTLKTFRMADGVRGQFVFESSPTLAKDVEHYFTGDANVELRAYVRFYNRARDVMMDARRAVQSGEGRP